ncbi:diacylglycerol/lipid kinase family protein [Dictyobacter arantiisoli]|uniref:DAGKc domain-containing protein n=1 Tax=Dictyobacter arantiisoli TaxID=2014874 RepID=A0A5A5TEQ2_9CHLR|nr:diacylglycerol kinase family protein [Dictyobacter arantiisoli]GCF09384.1 hypothetical protein KDI_29480 [Dictyobacter arantiisoli]
MSHKKASFLINPRTGENTAKLQEILAVLYAGGWKTEVALKEYGKHVMAMAAQAAEEKKNLVIAYGGDGTLNQVVNGVMSVKGKRPTVGLIPGGTANVWAGEVGIPNDPVKAALTLIDSDVRTVDVVRIAIHAIQFPGQEQPVEIAKAGKKAALTSSKVRHHFLLMAGIGLDAAVMGGVSKPLKYNIGPFAVGAAAVKELPRQHAFPIEIQAGEQDASLWKGEALQVVLGNTRRYARVERITPDAYVDDGQVDVCVITAGTPLSTIQQLSSLLLRQKPDNTTTEYFKGAHLRIKVPASAPLQVDGSAVKLKDYLSAQDYKKIEHLDKEGLDQVFITYQIDTLPEALPVAIPRTYSDELFQHDPNRHEDKGADEHDATETPGQRLHHGLFQRSHQTDDNVSATSSQQHTVAVESLPASELHSENGSEKDQKHEEEIRQTLPDMLDALVQDGKKVTVTGKVPNPRLPGTYVIAGTIRKTTDEIAPVAIVVNNKTTVFTREGHHVADIPSAIEELAEGVELTVEGKRSKHSVIQAKRLVLA